MLGELNIGLIGCGYWGPNLIRNFRSLTECQVKTVCDVDQDRLRHMKKLYPEIVTTNQEDDIFNDTAIDAVAIVTPVSLHYKLAMKSMKAGKHTFVEKPMASSVAECKEMVKLSQKQKLTLMVGHTFIYTSVVRKIKEIIDSGEIGEICYISSRRLNLGLFQNDINVAWDLAPHDISIILYLSKHPPISVSCQGKAHVAEGIEDVTNMSLDFSNGNFATIQSSWLDPNKIREMTIVGTKKMIVYNDMEPLEKIRIYDKRVETPPHYDTFAEFQCSYHYGDTYAPYIKQVEPLKVECQHFLDCIRTGAKPDSSGREGLLVVQILEASSQSLRNNGIKVSIDILS
ncbi:MAG: oxidoreductase [Phycisphaerae bacterium SM23_30]|nr:MAG: oxidoreductase [Phycisphaerae bacterium SM23_30]